MHISEDMVLPCQPRVVALLMAELTRPMPQLRRVNQLFGSDPVLSARLLALANAPAYQMSGQVQGIAQAVTLLGASQLRTLVRRGQQGMAVRAVPGMDLEVFWRHSVATAKLARTLAGMVRLPGSTAFTAGLLHSLGHLLPHQHAPSRAALEIDPAVGIWDPRRPRVEAERWGYSATALAAEMCQQWRFPPALVRALQRMEAPLLGDQLEPLAGVLHLAAWRTRTLTSQWSERSTALSYPTEVGVALGLDMDVVLQRESAVWQHSGWNEA